MKLKELYFSYYPPTENDFTAWWKEGLIVFDSNALLDLYGLQAETRDQFFQFLTAVKERLWIPHQVGFEFSKNRIKVINQQTSKYKAAIGRLESLLPEMKGRVEKAREDLVADVPESVRDVAKRVSSNFETLLTQIGEKTAEIEIEISGLIEKLKVERDAQTALIDKDPLFECLAELLGENIGDAYDEIKLTEIYTEGLKRYSTDPKTPPGYEDLNNKEKKGNEVYGDLLVWFQTIDKARIAARPILMVNSEQKSDWVEKSGDRRRVRRELIDEMYSKTKQPFLMYSLPDFMVAAKKYLDASFSVDALSDASRVEQEEYTWSDLNEENASETINTLLGSFILNWRAIERYIRAEAGERDMRGRNLPIRGALDLLRQDGRLSDDHYQRIVRLNYARSEFLHDNGGIPSEADVRDMITLSEEMIDELGIYNGSATLAVSRMLTKLYPSVELTIQQDKPSIFLRYEQDAIAVGIEFVSDINQVFTSTSKLLTTLTLGEGLVLAKNINRFVLVAVGGSKAIAEYLLAFTAQIELSPSSEIWIGYLYNGEFIPITNFHLSHLLFT